jgi:hypothetical protein
VSKQKPFVRGTAHWKEAFRQAERHECSALSREMRSLIEAQATGTFLKKDGLETLLWVLREAEKLDKKAKR